MIQKTKTEIKSAAELFSAPDTGNRLELVKGILIVMSPAVSEHGRIASRILIRLGNHVEANDLGETFAAETGFQIESNPDTVRAPDAAFVSHGRLSTVDDTSAYLALAPDLVVEVVSPNDSSSDVEAKVEQWLHAGSLIVLVADPKNETLRVSRNKSEIKVLHSGEVFNSGEVCNDWKLAVDDVFNIPSK
ncbi:MAG: Uma2 family endonuclease [Planctomycetota bacterium]